jgi:hypothetical protein
LSSKEEESKNHNGDLEQATVRLLNATESGDFLSLFNSKESLNSYADTQVILAILLYPNLIKKLIERAAKTQINQAF